MPEPKNITFTVPRTDTPKQLLKELGDRLTAEGFLQTEQIGTHLEIKITVNLQKPKSYETK